MTYSTTITIGGNNVSAYCFNWTRNEVTQQEIDSIKINLTKQAFDAYSIEPGQEVSIVRETTTVFGGYVEGFKKNGPSIEVTCKDYGYGLLRRIVNESYTTKRPDEIIKEICDIYFTDFDYTNVQESGLTLDRYVVNRKNAFEVFKNLAEFEGWQFYVDVDKKLYFEPKGYTESGVTINIGTNGLKLGEWSKDKIGLINSLEVFGKRRLIEKYETFSGDDVTVDFVLTYNPEGHVRVLVDSVELKGGIENATSGAQYYVDIDTKTITFVTAPASTAPANIEVYYGYTVPLAIASDDENSIATYTQHDSVQYKNFIETRNDLINYVGKELTNKANPVLGGRVETSEMDLNAGDYVTVVDAKNAVNQKFVITKIKESYPKKTLIVDLGIDPEHLQDVSVDQEARIKQLEESLQGSTSLITKLKNFSEEFEIDLNESAFKVEHRTIGTAFILNSSTNGILGTSTLGSGTMSAYSIDINE